MDSKAVGEGARSYTDVLASFSIATGCLFYAARLVRRDGSARYITSRAASACRRGGAIGQRIRCSSLENTRASRSRRRSGRTRIGSTTVKRNGGFVDTWADSLLRTAHLATRGFNSLSIVRRERLQKRLLQLSFKAPHNLLLGRIFDRKTPGCIDSREPLKQHKRFRPREAKQNGSVFVALCHCTPPYLRRVSSWPAPSRHPLTY